MSATNLVVRNTTISDNFVNYDGSAINGSTGNTTADITNSIVYFNVLGTGPNHIFPTNFYNITFSDVEGGYTGTGNIDAFPLFEGVGDYRLSDASPCIDAGTDLTAEGITVDIEDIPRPQGPGFDMGAYENLVPVPEERKLCEDGIDNDGDGLTDCADPDCARYRTCR